MTIPTLDPPLASDDVATFNSKAFDFVSDLVTWTTEVNSAGTTIATNASTASAAASTATTQAAVATSAATAAGAVAWVSGTTYAEGDVRYDTTDFLTYRRKTAGAGTTRPGLDSTNWALLVVSHNIVRRAITGADTVVVTDKAGLLDITSGTFTLAYTAAAALGSGFWCVVRNSGTGDVTHDPASSETIDGLTSFVMYPGEARLIQCDGTAFRSVVLSGFSRTFTASGTFTKPPGYNAFGMLLWGAGASGGKGDGSTQAGGGGGGACFSGTIPASAVSTTESVTIGSGGVAVTASVTAGNVGGNSSFGSLITSYGGGGNSIVGGGGGGLKSAGSSATGGTPAELFNGGGTGGNSAAGFASYYGGGGGGGGSTDAAYAGGASVYGGGGGGNAPATTAGAGGTSVFGGAGGAGGVATNGTAGTAPGGGGGATKSGTQSGAGARGELRIWGIA